MEKFSEIILNILDFILHKENNILCDFDHYQYILLKLDVFMNMDI